MTTIVSFQSAYVFDAKSFVLKLIKNPFVEALLQQS